MRQQLWVYCVCGIVGFCVGRGAELMWSDWTSPWTWWGIAAAVLVFCLGGLAAWNYWYVPWSQAGGTQAVLLWVGKSIQPIAIVALSAALFIVLVGPKIISLGETLDGLREAENQLLRTRPTCDADCGNFDWVVELCTRVAVMEGSLTGSPIGADAKRATRYLRGCLIDRGMDWKSCNKGERDCLRLRYVGMVSPGANLPSFTD